MQNTHSNLSMKNKLNETHTHHVEKESTEVWVTQIRETITKKQRSLDTRHNGNLTDM